MGHPESELIAGTSARCPFHKLREMVVHRSIHRCAIEKPMRTKRITVLPEFPFFIQDRIQEERLILFNTDGANGGNKT